MSHVTIVITTGSIILIMHGPTGAAWSHNAMHAGADLEIFVRVEGGDGNHSLYKSMSYD